MIPTTFKYTVKSKGAGVCAGEKEKDMWQNGKFNPGPWGWTGVLFLSCNFSISSKKFFFKY